MLRYGTQLLTPHRTAHCVQAIKMSHLELDPAIVAGKLSGRPGPSMAPDATRESEGQKSQDQQRRMRHALTAM